MKDTFYEDFQTLIDYHFGPEKDERYRLALKIVWLLRPLRNGSISAIEDAEDVLKAVRRLFNQRLGLACKKCGGEGMIGYPSGSTWRGGMGVASCTDDVCDACWGTGRSDMQGLDLREVPNE